jgi:hypothetical protein
MIIPSESNPNHFVAEASDIGWAPGLIPRSFVWNGKTFHLVQMVRTGYEDELQAMEYRAADGSGMTVFND